MFVLRRIFSIKSSGFNRAVSNKVVDAQPQEIFLLLRSISISRFWTHERALCGQQNQSNCILGQKGESARGSRKGKREGDQSMHVWRHYLLIGKPTESSQVKRAS